MNLNTVFPAFQRVSSGPGVPTVDNEKVGTVEAPYAAPPLVRVPTGRAAQQSVQDRWKNFTKNPERYADVALPVDGRAQRRAAAAKQRRAAKKGRRAFVRRQWAQERAAQ